mmetsp:Transcript_12851/g.28533  ORF Transcript_12851/g.28533 Transcript_12851/m.28533 type:complete len:232 (+) Transcript_12851:403-1098(+)
MASFIPKKFDVKFLLVPVVVFFARNVDFNKDVVNTVNGAFVAVVVFVLTLHLVLYRSISSTKDLSSIWLPPKSVALPFGWGSSVSRLTLEDFEPTTYFALETKLLRESVHQTLTTCVIAYATSQKFGQICLLVLTIALPISISNHPVFKKHVLGSLSQLDGSGLFDELREEPDAAMLAVLNAASGASASAPAPVGDEVSAEHADDTEGDGKDSSQEKAKKNSKGKGKGKSK